MKRRKIIIITAIVLILILAFGFWKFRSNGTEIILATEKPHFGYIANAITATGTIQPDDTVAVGTQVSGTISRVYADFNSKVKKGQLLAELDKTILNAQVQQANANLLQARSQLTYQESNVNRQEQLYKAGAVSKADYETALNSYKLAKAAIESSSSQVTASKKNLSLANIYSPIDGTVLARNVSEGQTVAASFNTPTLFSIAKDLTHMQVRASVDEADIGNVKQGQRVSFTVDAFPDDQFEGTVLEVRLQPSVQSNVVTYTTIISANNQDLKLKPGMTANISIYTKEENNAMLVSAKAIKFRPDSLIREKYTVIDSSGKKRNREQTASNPGAYSINHKESSTDSIKRAVVWVLNENTISRKLITTGLSDGTQVQVLSGLTEADLVIDGVQQSGKATANQNSNQRSPFMPQRRQGQGGGGGNRPQSGGRPS
jgi:HlyD family secretion protein